MNKIFVADGKFLFNLLVKQQFLGCYFYLYISAAFSGASFLRSPL